MRKLICMLALGSLVLLLAGCTSSEYDVIVHPGHIHVTGDSVASVTEDFCITLEAEELYRLPRSVEVTVGGAVLPAEEYSYDSDSGSLRIPAERITGAVEISAEAEQISYAVTVDAGSVVSIQGETVAFPRQKYKATLAVPEYYLLPESVFVRVCGELLEEEGYTYDASTGELVILADISGDIRITAIAEPVAYELDISAVTGAELSCGEVFQAMPAFGFTATLICSEGYDLPQTVEILVDGEVLDPDSYTYDASTGELMIPGQAITGKLELRSAGVAKIAGDWTATVDASPLVQQYAKSSDPTMAAYFDFHGLYVDIQLHLGADARGSVTVDRSSFSRMMDKAQGQAAEGIKDMLQELLAAQGLNFSVDEYLVLAGIDLKSLVAEYVNTDSVDISALNFESLYLVDGDKIYLFEKEFDPEAEDYLVYSLEGDRLVISSAHGNAPVPGYMLPLTLERAAR